MGAPRWLADEMVGRLARYLRFVGQDTAYVQGLTHDEIVARAARESRRIVTRCRTLADRVPGTLLLTSTGIADQVRAVRGAVADDPFDLTFERCSLCNGQLDRWRPPDALAWPADVPRERVERGLEVYQCHDCDHRFWEGSHTRAIRLSLRGWLS
jgi:uncharacterized protein with PIN domain